MPTIATLITQGGLTRIEVQLGAREQPDRVIYGSATFMNWLQNTLPTLQSSWNIDETPAEQMDALLYNYIVGDMMQIGTRYKQLRPYEENVWELKSADLRVFGWFAMRDTFIAGYADTTDRVKQYALYRGYINQTVRLRDQLNLDEGYLTGGELDVISI